MLSCTDLQTELLQLALPPAQHFQAGVQSMLPKSAQWSGLCKSVLRCICVALCSQITPGNSFCGTVPAALARTPDGKGQRFKIAPPGKQGDDSYHLAACTGERAECLAVIPYLVTAHASCHVQSSTANISCSGNCCSQACRCARHWNLT